jgi:UDP-N-acetylmuramoyl-L-alanyl-D-glutamate--2,6-diaminopimelate ligase
MTLSKLLANTEVLNVQGNIDIKVSGIAFNSAEVKPGDVFVCISGFKTDGHKYVSDALEKGAVAIVAEKLIEDTAVTVAYVENTRHTFAYMAAEYFDYPFKKFKLVSLYP